MQKIVSGLQRDHPTIVSGLQKDHRTEDEIRNAETFLNASCYEIHLTLPQLVRIVLTAAPASVRTAGTPGAWGIPQGKGR